MTYLKSTFEHDGQFIQATRDLALPHESTLDVPLVSHKTQLQAITLLLNAPEEEHWDRSLLQGLRSANEEIIEKSAEACVERLKNASDAERQDKLIKIMLDACFLNLSGRSGNFAQPKENRRIAQQERAAAKLFQTITKYLKENPLNMEHHRSRLLAHGRIIERLNGQGKLADAVLAFQYSLGTEAQRSDNLDATELHILRKSESYQSPKTKESALLAYLKQDRQLKLEQVSQELFQNYRFLLNYQHKETAGEAILLAIENLTLWLDSILQNRQHSSMMIDVLKNRAKHDWGELMLSTKRHLEAHLELLPGADHPEDFLKLLREKYNNDKQQSEEILIRGLKLLKRFPLMRYRITEFCEFTLDSTRIHRKVVVWKVFFELIETLLTGLADFTLIDQQAIGKTERRRNKAKQSILSADKKLRDTLIKIKEDAQVADQARELAWRVLLRCLPAERNQLYRQGLHDDNGRFFIATVEEAAKQRQRSLWHLLIRDWDKFVINQIDDKKRQIYIQTIVNYFRQTRIYEGIQNDGQIGPLISLALDDKDVNIRLLTENAIIEAGYETELQRERQKRKLIQLNDKFEENFQQVIKFDKQSSELSTALSAEHTKRATHTLHVQTLLQQRESIMTQGWIDASHLQVDLAEVKEILKATLKQAAREAENLKDLQRRMSSELQQSRNAYAETKSLVNEQKNCEQKIKQLRWQRDKAERNLQSAESELRSASNELNHLSNNWPSSPSYIPSDPDEARRVEQNYRRAYANHQSQIDRQEDHIQRLQHRISKYENEIYYCRKGIVETQETLENLQNEINRIRRRIEDIERNISGLRSEFRAGKSRWEALRRKINELENEADAIAHRYATQRQKTHSKIAQNERDINQQHSALARLREQIQALQLQWNQANDQLNQYKTLSQELNQAIETGREYYDNIGNRAKKESKLADVTGESLQQQQEQQIVEKQELLAFYAHGIQHEIAKQTAPPTRDKHQQRRRPTRRSKSKE